MSQAGGWYDATYGRFALDARARVRQETYGEDIGSNGWMNANELCLFIHWLGLDEAWRVLDVACGSGGPSLFIAQNTGARVTGVDVNEAAIATASMSARERALDGRADFRVADATAPLPFEAGTFDGCSASIRSITWPGGRPSSVTGTACCGRAGACYSQTRSS